MFSRLVFHSLGSLRDHISNTKTPQMHQPIIQSIFATMHYLDRFNSCNFCWIPSQPLLYLAPFGRSFRCKFWLGVV